MKNQDLEVINLDLFLNKDLSELNFINDRCKFRLIDKLDNLTILEGEGKLFNMIFNIVTKLDSSESPYKDIKDLGANNFNIEILKLN
jgi:hypothetical protein